MTKPRPEEPIPTSPFTWQDVEAELVAESVRIRAAQRALVAAGDREAPCPVQMRRAEIFNAASLFVKRAGSHWAEVRDLLRRLDWGRR